MNDEDWMKKRSWRKGSGCAFLLLGILGLGWISVATSVSPSVPSYLFGGIL